MGDGDLGFEVDWSNWMIWWSSSGLESIDPIGWFNIAMKEEERSVEWEEEIVRRETNERFEEEEEVQVNVQN